MLLRLRTKPGTARHWSGFAKPRRRPRSPNSTKPKCPWEGTRFRSKTRTAKWPTFVLHSIGCTPMQAPVFGRLCPPNSCSTTRIDPRDQLDQLDRRDQWGRLRPLRPFRPVQLGLDHPAHLLVPVDLGGPPPHWNNSKRFYLLNIQNTWTTTMPFVRAMMYCDIFACYKKCTFLTFFYKRFTDCIWPDQVGCRTVIHNF